jgi:nitrite reductase/ring-hydroxylating ferredoxin subunit
MTASGNGTEHDTGLRPQDLDPERPLSIETPWGAVALYRIGDEVLAAESFCPHLQGPLFQGTLTGDEITCPWHRWRFSLRTGERVPGDEESARSQSADRRPDPGVLDPGELVPGELGGRPDARITLYAVLLGPEGTLHLRPGG